MPSFADSIFLFVLALLLFGPKKLPVLARELGKWVGEFRRASNEFKFQMEEELRASEQADRQKQIAAMEAAAPLPPALDQPEHPHLRSRTAPHEKSLLSEGSGTAAMEAAATAPAALLGDEPSSPETVESSAQPSADSGLAGANHEPGSEDPTVEAATASGPRPIPIATAGDLHMMPPATGLPVARPRTLQADDTAPLAGMLEAIPEAPLPVLHGEALPETAVHGD